MPRLAVVHQIVGVLCLGFVALVIVANLSCAPKYFQRGDVIALLAIGLADAVLLLGASWDDSSCNPRAGEKNPFVAFYGDRGMLTLAGGNDYTVTDNAGKQVEQKTGGPGGGDAPHFQNFSDAIRERKPLNSPISEGQKSSMLCHLANIALRTSTVLKIDPKTGHIQGNSAAQKLWKREYRPGWEPKI